MKLTTHGASRLALLGFLATQFGSILSSPLAEPFSVSDLAKRSCTYPLKFGTGTAKMVMLSYTSITETLAAVLSITGNIGAAPAGGVVNIPAASVTGTIYTNTPSATSALATASATCSCAAVALPRTTIAATSITGSTFTPGTYYFAGALNLAASGSVTFDAGGVSAAQFYMIIDGALVTGASSTVILKNGAKACNIFWVIGPPASSGGADTTLGASSVFNGNICDWGAITAGAGVTYTGLMVTLKQTAASVITIDGGTFKSVPIC